MGVGEGCLEVVGGVLTGRESNRQLSSVSALAHLPPLTPKAVSFHPPSSFIPTQLVANLEPIPSNLPHPRTNLLSSPLSSNSIDLKCIISAESNIDGSCLRKSLKSKSSAIPGLSLGHPPPYGKTGGAAVAP